MVRFWTQRAFHRVQELANQRLGEKDMVVQSWRFEGELEKQGPRNCVNPTLLLAGSTQLHTRE